MEAFYDLVDGLASPITYTVITWVAFFAMMKWVRVLVRPLPALVILFAMTALFVVGAQDHDFYLIITKGDNMPIVIMIFAVMFCMWLAFKQAVANDMAIEKGEPPGEALEANKKVLVWPDLIFPEFLMTVALSAVFIAWGVLVEAPIEEPASGTRAPNPAKAPWYFLGLQEMLVYFDPWLAGVVLPGMIVVGLMAIPYIDINPKGNGYYTLKERPFAIGMFMFGFLVLWVTMVILGTFLRGPNWNFFGPFEYWDPHKVEPLVNVNLSEFFWVRWLDRPMPDEAMGSPTLGMLLRETPGIILIGLYFLITPALLAKTVMKSFFNQMGFVRFSILMQLLLFMAALPIKMLARWIFNLKYLVAFPEWFFNI